MSKYSTEVRYICESLAGKLESEGYKSVNQIIADSRAKIFSFDYPLFDAAYKPELEAKILKHYYTREICAETYGRWKLFLESRMQEIMPFYNELYKTTLKEYDIFEDVNYSRTGERTSEEAGTNSSEGSVEHSGTDSRTDTSTAENTSWQKYSDTPQGAITDIESDSYLTNATKNTSEDSGSLTSSGENAFTDSRADSGEHTKNVLEEYSEIIKGKYPGKSYMELIKEFRDNLLNIDKMIIDELSDLFMMVY